MKKTFLIIVVLVLMGFLSESGAVLIDFKSSAFSSANGLTSFYYNPEGLTIEALPDGAKIYQDSSDGLGVNSYSNSSTYEWDEIEGIERLHLHFNANKLLNEILITDLFYEPSNNISGQYLWSRKKSCGKLSHKAAVRL